MPKLLVAIAVSPEVAGRLVAIQPTPRAGIRLVEPRQMHVTLARCQAGVPASVAEEFLEAHQVWRQPAFAVSSFGQYSTA